MKSCWECGGAIEGDAKHCPHCGVATSREAVRGMATVGPGGGNVKQIVIGATIADRYEIRRELGRGGMGIVYLAFDKTMAKEVALKVIPQELCLDPRAVADLKRETGISLNLTHEHIVRLYNLDIWEGQAFVTMEYVSGGTLAHLLAEKECYTLAEILPLLQQMAAALDYSHNATPPVIHRDLKPLNVLMTEDGRIKIADFGLARVLRDSASRVSGHESAGTLAYMAPEQVRGKGIGRQTDLYAFAAITYELLCGHPPFYTGDLRWQILHEEVEPIEGVSEHINTVLARALDKEGSNRPVSAAEFIRLLSGEQAAAAPTKSGKKTASKNSNIPVASPSSAARGRKAVFGLTTFLILVLLALGFWYLGGWYYNVFNIWRRATGEPELPKTISATETTALGTLEVSSTPSGSRVQLDQQEAGVTPYVNGTLPEGVYSITVANQGYKSWSGTATIKPGTVSKQHAELTMIKRVEPIVVEPIVEKIKPAKSEPPAPKAGDLYTDPTTTMEFVYVPGGCFQMGSPASEKDREADEGPMHEVCVDGMYL